MELIVSRKAGHSASIAVGYESEYVSRIRLVCQEVVHCCSVKYFALARLLDAKLAILVINEAKLLHSVSSYMQDPPRLAHVGLDGGVRDTPTVARRSSLS